MYTELKPLPKAESAIAPTMTVVSDNRYDAFWRGCFVEAIKADEHACKFLFAKSVVDTLHVGGRPSRIIFVSIDSSSEYANVRQACLLSQLTGAAVISLTATRNIEHQEIAMLRELGVSGVICLDHAEKVTNPYTGVRHEPYDYVPILILTIKRLIDACVSPIVVESPVSRDQLLLPASNVPALKQRAIALNDGTLPRPLLNHNQQHLPTAA